MAFDVVLQQRHGCNPSHPATPHVHLVVQGLDEPGYLITITSECSCGMLISEHSYDSREHRFNLPDAIGRDAHVDALSYNAHLAEAHPDD